MRGLVGVDPWTGGALGWVEPVRDERVAEWEAGGVSRQERAGEAGEAGEGGA